MGFYHIWAWRPSWSCVLDHCKKGSPGLVGGQGGFELRIQVIVKMKKSWERGSVGGGGSEWM